VATWDDKDLPIFKPEKQLIGVQPESKADEHKHAKNAAEIQFGGAKPVFGGGMPRFGKSKNEKIVNEEEFPDLGGVLIAKDAKKDNKVEKEQPSNGIPQFSNVNNRFEGLQNIAQQTTTDAEKDRRPKERTQKPKEKDTFFGNFRETNKEIKSKESEIKAEPIAADADDENKPKFNFVNNKKGAMTMAKQQEEAMKLKELQEKQKVHEEKKKPFEKKTFEKKPYKPKFEDKAPEAEKKSLDKPKAKKPKVVKEKAELGESEWGAGNLEDILK
jgi:hypothetical protein